MEFLVLLNMSPWRPLDEYHLIKLLHLIWRSGTCRLYRYLLYYTPLLNEVEGGILVSACPSVRPWTESYPLCIFHNTSQIHLIFTDLNNQLQKLCYMLKLSENFNFLAIFYNLFKLAPLTLSCVHVIWMLKVDSSSEFLAATKQLYEWSSPSVRLSVRHTIFIMFPSSYHENFRSYYLWQKWCPCK